MHSSFGDHRLEDSLKIAEYLVDGYRAIISALSAYKSAYIRSVEVLILFQRVTK